LLVPSLGGAMVGDDFDLDRWSVLGWSVLAAATAAATPYGVLAAVRGRQGATLLVRLADAVCSLIGIAIAMQLDWSGRTVPYVLATSALLGGLGIRMLIVADMKAKRVAA
jgi:hypothetical protein